MTPTPLQRAVDIAGGQSALARKIGTRQSLIWYWLTRAKRGVPAEFCGPIERETGVPASELRPDMFGTNAGHAAAAPLRAFVQCDKDEAADADRHVNPGTADLPGAVQ